MTEPPLDLMLSMQTVLRHEDIVVCKFYDKFFHECPQAKVFFDGIDIRQQAVKLTSALNVLELHHRHASPAAQEFLEYLGRHHDELGIPSTLYSGFRSALLETLRDFHGDEWHAALAAEWEAAIDTGIQVMLSQYRR